jgi:hypothetical protein
VAHAQLAARRGGRGGGQKSDAEVQIVVQTHAAPAKARQPAVALDVVPVLGAHRGIGTALARGYQTRLPVLDDHVADHCAVALKAQPRPRAADVEHRCVEAIDQRLYRRTVIRVAVVASRPSMRV